MADDLPVRQAAVEERSDKADKYRLHLSVPKPLSRVNLGMPWYEKLRGTTFDDRVPKFGYKGISLQTDSYFFADIEKHSLFHTGKSMQQQAGKEWLQYSSASSWMATEQDSTVAADVRMTIVAGAGQGARDPLDHGMEVRTDAYNNLYLHYRVDSVMMGISEFMTGRREREEPWGLLEGFRPFAGREYNSKKDHIVADEGFWDILARAAELLGPGLPDFEGLYKIFPKFESGKHHEHYGYGKTYFTTFDPYEMKKTDEPNVFLSAFLVLKNMGTLMRRFADVTSKLSVAIVNLPLVRQAAKLMESVDKFSSALDASQRVAYAFGAGKATNEDKVMFGEEAPFDKQMLDVLYPIVDHFSGHGAEEDASKVAAIEFVAPPNPAFDPNAMPPQPRFLWNNVPAGIYGKFKTGPEQPDDEKMYTNKVPGRLPKVKAKKAAKAISAPVQSVVTLSLHENPISETIELGADLSAAVTALNGAAMFGGAAPFRVVPDHEGHDQLHFNPAPIFRFESLTVADAQHHPVSALGLGDGTVTFTGPQTPGLHMHALDAGSSVTLTLTRRADPLAFTIAWTAGDTVSAAAAASAITREARQAGLPAGFSIGKVMADGKLQLAAPAGYQVSIGGDANDELGFSETGPAEHVDASGAFTVGFGRARWIAVATDQGGVYLALSEAYLPAATMGSTAANIAPLVAAINATIGGAASDAGGGKLEVKSTNYGAQAFAEVRADSVQTLVDYLGFETPEGGAVVRQEGQDISISPDQLAQLIKCEPTFGEPNTGHHMFAASRLRVTVDNEKGIVKVQSLLPIDHADYEYYLGADGDLLHGRGAVKLKDYVPRKTVNEKIDDFQKLLAGLKSLPEDLAEVVRPITNMVQDVVGFYNDVLKGFQALVEPFAGSRFLPESPPSSLGIFAKDGITLGTTNKIMSAAGKGYVFIADGGTGQRDTEKFTLGIYERLITNLAANELKGVGDWILGPPGDTEAEKEKSGAGGFTVFSNSSTSLVTRSTLDLLAIGSLKKGEGDDAKLLGRGVARLAATRSVEVAAHSRVTIAATASKEKNVAVKAKRVKEDYDGTPLELDEGGGEVELLAERIRLGAPLTHLAYMPLADKIPWPLDKKTKDEMRLKLPMAERAYAPPTKEVVVGAMKSIEATTTPYLLQVKSDGIFLGGPGGAKGEAFSKRKKAEEKAIKDHFEEQKTYWKLVKKDALKNKEKAAANHMKLKNPLKAGEKVEGMAARDWAKMETYYEKLRAKAEEYETKVGDAKHKALEDLDHAYEELEEGPALVMDKEKIILGFQKKAGGAWGPHLKITKDGVTVMLSDASKDASTNAKLELKSSSVVLQPGDGTVKLEMGSSEAKIQAAPGKHIHWKSGSVDGSRIKNI
jgi:hypothetical protein